MMKKILKFVLYLLLFAMLLFSGWQICRTLYARYQTQSGYEKIRETVVRTEAEPKKGSEVPISVDFDALRAENPDVIGWLYCADTPVNYPVVQHADNTYYLTHLADGTVSSAGALFLDFRCDRFDPDEEIVIYGHNMRDGSMFGTLPKFRDKAYAEAHSVLWLLTPEQNYRITVAAAGVLDENAAPYEMNDATDFEIYARQHADDMAYFSDTAQWSDRVIALSTCSYDYRGARFVLLGTMAEETP